MDWTIRDRVLIRPFSALFLFAGARSFRRNCSDLGAGLLRFCAGQSFRWPRIHAGHAIA